MKCPKCFAETKAGEKFCGACGSEITAVQQGAGRACPSCRAMAPDSEASCPECGSPMPKDAPKAPAQKPWLAPALGVAALLFGSGGYLFYRNITTSDLSQTPRQNPLPPSDAPKPPDNPQQPPQQPPAETPATPPTQPPPQQPPPQQQPQRPVSPAPPDRPAPSIAPRPENTAPQNIPVVPAPPKPEKPHVDIIKPEQPPQPPAKLPDKPDNPQAPPYTGPRSGLINWSGQIEKGGVVTFNGESASSGAVNGKLPGVPVMLEINTREFAFAETPAPSNGWTRFAVRSRNRRHVVISIKWSVLE